MKSHKISLKSHYNYDITMIANHKLPVAENPLGLAKHTEAYYEVRQRSVQSLAEAPLREAGKHANIPQLWPFTSYNY